MENENFIIPSFNSVHHVPPHPSMSSNSDSSNPNGRYPAPLPPHNLHSLQNPPPIFDEYPDDVDMPVVSILTTEVQPQVTYWRSAALIGHFVGRIPEVVEIQALLGSLWNAQFTVRTYDDDLLLISFDNCEMANRILAGSPWPLPGSYLILKSWEPGLTPHRVDIGLVPTKISLWELPIEYWELPTLTRVVEPIGTLISVEGDNSTYANIRVLRAIVLVDVRRRRRYHLTVRCGRRVNVVAVTYDDNPRVCIVCGGFGHSHVHCQSGAGEGKDWSRTNEGTVDFPPTNDQSQGMAGGGWNPWGYGGTAHHSQGNEHEGSLTLADSALNMQKTERAVSFGGVFVENSEEGGKMDVSIESELMASFDEVEQHLQVGMLFPEEELDQSSLGAVQEGLMGVVVGDVHESPNFLRGACMGIQGFGKGGHVNNRDLTDVGIEADPLPSTEEVIQQLRLDLAEQSRVVNLVGVINDVSRAHDGVHHSGNYNPTPKAQGTLEDVIRGVVLQSETGKVVREVGSSTSMAAEEVREFANRMEFAKRMEDQEKIDGSPIHDEKMVVVVVSSDSSEELGEKGKKRKSSSISTYERAVAVSSRVRGRLKLKSTADVLRATKECRTKRARYPVRKVKRSIARPCTKLTLAPPSQEQEAE